MKRDVVIGVVVVLVLLTGYRYWKLFTPVVEQGVSSHVESYIPGELRLSLTRGTNPDDVVANLQDEYAEVEILDVDVLSASMILFEIGSLSDEDFKGAKEKLRSDWRVMRIQELEDDGVAARMIEEDFMENALAMKAEYETLGLKYKYSFPAQYEILVGVSDGQEDEWKERLKKIEGVFSVSRLEVDAEQ